MLSSLRKYQILPPLFAFVAGILLAERFGNEWLTVVLVSPALGFVCLFKPRLAFLMFIPIGILFAARPDLPDDHVSSFTGKRIDIEGVLFKSPESRTKGSRFFIDVESVFTDGKEESASGKVIVTTEERISGLAYGDRVRILETKLKPFRNFLNPGNFDIERYYERQGIYASGFIPGKGWIISFGKDRSSNSFIHAVDRLRVKFGNFVRSESPFPESEILSAVTVGDQGGIPPELRNRLSATGVAHVLSISGLHVGAVALVFYFLIKWILKRSEFLLLRFQVPRITAALTIVPVFIYVIIAGFATPAVRAFIMAAVYLTSIVINREENKLNALAVAAFIILLWHPWAIFELSFQLSFASVLGIILMHRFYPLKLNTFRDKSLTSAKTTVAASFSTLPFIINTFGVLPVVSIPANLIFVPLVEFLIVPLGLISFLVFFISESAALPFLYINVFLTKSFIWGNDQFLQIPFSSLTVPSLGFASWTFYWLMLAAFLFIRTYRKFEFAVPVLVLCFLGVSAYAVLKNPDKGLLQVNFLDAGNKNVVFIKLPGEKTILIDGGFSRYESGGFIETSVVSPFLLKSGITKIDYLILTSLDKDHLQGAANLMQKFQVERFWTNGARLNGGLWETIRDKNIRWKNISEDVENFELEGVEIEFFKPGFSIEDSSRSYPLIIKLRFGKDEFLFGELINDEEVQEELIQTYVGKIKAGVLYMPKMYGQIKPDFLGAVSPRVIVTDTAAAGFRHSGMPESGGSDGLSPALFQTDVNGAVTVLTDGKRIRVRTFSDGDKELVY